MLQIQYVASNITTTDQTVHTRKCMLDTFTQKCTWDYTAAYTINEVYVVVVVFFQ